MMEAGSSSEASVNIYQTTRRNIPEGNRLHSRRHENLKSHHYSDLYISAMPHDNVNTTLFYLQLAYSHSDCDKPHYRHTYYPDCSHKYSRNVNWMFPRSSKNSDLQELTAYFFPLSNRYRMKMLLIPWNWSNLALCAITSFERRAHFYLLIQRLCL
jgi:hypothetical protein